MKHSYVHAAIATLLMACTGVADAQDLSAGEQMQFADGLYSRGLYRAALEEYQIFIKNNADAPNLDVANFRLAECARQTGDHKLAVRAYKRVRTDHPKSQYYHRAGFRRAEVFVEQEQFGAALELFDEVLKETPPDDIKAAALYMKGMALTRLKRSEEASDAFQAILDQHNDSEFFSYALLSQAELLKQKEQYVEAAALYRQAAEKPATDAVAAEAWFQLADALFRQEKYEESAKAYTKLMADFPNDARAQEALLQTAWAFHNAGLYADALRVIERAPRQDLPDEEAAQWLYVKANCERQLMSHAAAVATYREILKQYAKTRYAASSGYELALVHYRAGEHDKAIKWAKPHVDDERLAPDVTWLMAESYAAMGRDDEAVQYYRILAEKYPENLRAADASFRLARLLQERGQFQQAALHYRNLIKNHPENELLPQALFAAAYCLAREGRHDEAVRDWAQVIQLKPDAAILEEATYQKAMSEIHLKQDEAAQATLHQLIEGFPKSKRMASAHFWFGILAHQAEHVDDAERFLRSAIELTGELELKKKAEFHLGHVLYRQQKYDEAVGLLQGLLTSPIRNRFSAEMLEWIANYRLDQGQAEEAVQAALEIVNASDMPAWRQLGWCLAGRGYFVQKKNKKARVAFEKAIDQKARTRYAPEAALRLGDLHFSENSCKKAEKYYRMAADWSTSDEFLAYRAHAFAGLGRVSQCLDDHDTAIRRFLIVTLLFEDNTIVPESYCLMLDSYEILGRNEDLERTREELRERYPDTECPKE